MRLKPHVRFWSRAGMATFRLRQRRQSREVREHGECEGAARLKGLQEHVRRAAHQKVSAKTALEGKPDALKGARPVWEGAR
jgi:hypothetical protein